MKRNENFNNIEKEILENNLNYQSLVKKSLLKYTDEIASNSISSFRSSDGEIAYSYLSQIKLALQKTDENIEYISSLLVELSKIPVSSKNSQKETLLKKYNEQNLNYQKIITENNIEIKKTLNSLLDYIKFDFSRPSINDLLNNNYKSNTTTVNNESNLVTKQETNPKEISSVKNIIEDIAKERNLIPGNQENNNYTDTNETIEQGFVQNTLIISETQNKVILPYFIDDLNNILNENPEKYDNIQTIIDNEYTIPMNYYKNASISRFKEAYNLIRKRNNGTIREALQLGLELFFQYDLNPAIITACKTLDELDIYLACLEENELDEFNCFKITYEMHPISILKQKK